MNPNDLIIDGKLDASKFNFSNINLNPIKMATEHWVVVSLDSGHYMGIERVFNSMEEARDYAISEGFVKADESEFPYYGVVDYVIPNREKFRLAIEKVTVTHNP